MRFNFNGNANQTFLGYSVLHPLIFEVEQRVISKWHILLKRKPRGITNFWCPEWYWKAKFRNL